MTSKPPANTKYRVTKVITRAYMVGAVAVSFTHIVHAFGMLGLHGWQAWTTPAFIDGLAVLGVLGRGEEFAPSTRRIGLRFQMGAGLVSLAANVYAGESVGARVLGVIAVVGFIAAEAYADRMRPAPAPVEVAIESTHTRRSEAAKRGAVKAKATRAANAAVKAQAEADRLARVEAKRIARRVKAAEISTQTMDAAFATSVAPVSPSPYL